MKVVILVWYSAPIADELDRRLRSLIEVFAKPILSRFTNGHFALVSTTLSFETVAEVL